MLEGVEYEGPQKILSKCVVNSKVLVETVQLQAYNGIRNILDLWLFIQENYLEVKKLKCRLMDSILTYQNSFNLTTIILGTNEWLFCLGFGASEVFFVW